MSIFLPFSFGSRSLESKSQAFYYTGKDQTFNFIGGQTYTVYAWGAAGANSSGGAGAYVSGVFTPSTSGTATIIVGQCGNTGSYSSYGGGGIGRNGGGGGGGRSSLMIGTSDIVTVGAGGGAGATGGYGGASYSNGVFTSVGGDASGGDGRGGGATMSAGGAGGSAYYINGDSGQPGSFHQGGLSGNYTGWGGQSGGGGGYYGGGGGGGSALNGPGAGGGGSSYINTSYFSCISAAQSTAVPTSSSLTGVVQALYNSAGYVPAKAISANTGHGLIIIVQNSTTFNPTYLPGCMLWLDAADVDGTGVTTTSTVLSLASFVPASPTTQEVSYSVSSQYYYSLSNWTPVSCVMNGAYINGSQPQTANLAPSATTGIWYAYWNDGSYCKMVKLQFSITSGRIYVTALSAGYVSSASSITSSTTGAQNDTIYNSATSTTVATSSSSPGYGVSSFSIKTSGVPSTGSSVSTWVDKSGNSNTFTLPSGSYNAPTYGTDTGSLQSVNFTAASCNVLYSSTSIALSNSTFFYVFTPTSYTSSAGRYLDACDANNADYITQGGFAIADAGYLDFQQNGNYQLSNLGSPPAGSRVLISFMWNGTAFTTYKNGVQQYSNTYTKGTTTHIALGVPIGSGNTISTNQFGTFNANELIAFSTVLTAIQRRQVEMYLAWKWGLGSPLSTFSPANINGLALWLDGADAGTVILNGSNVTQWNDKSGKNYNLTGSSTTGITYSSNTLSFPGTSTGYLSNTTSGIPLRTLFMVASSANGSTLTASAAVNGQSQAGAYYAGTYATSVGASIFTTTFNGSGSSDTNQFLNSNTTSANTTYLIEATYDPSGQTLVLYINGSNSGTYTYSTSLTTKTPTGLFIGGNWYNNSLTAIVSTFNEILMFNTILTAGQRQQIEGYLAWKWGLYSSLPSSHPNRYTLPTSAPFSPLLIPGCSLWIDASDTSTITLNGSNLAKVTDKSGNNVDLGTSSGFVYPRTFNGSYPSFYNANSSGQVASNASFSLPNNFTVAFVAQRDTGAGSGAGFIFNSGASDPTYRAYIWDPSSNVYYSRQQWTNAFSYNPNVGVANFSSSPYFYVNGTNVVTYTENPIQYTSSNLAVFLGNTNGGGYSCEFLIFSGSLTTTQRQQIEGYLAWKWGIQGSLPSTHPFYKASPGAYTIPTNILYSLPQDALSYLILDVSSKDYGIAPQPVTTNGTVTYTTIGGKKCAYFNNSTSNYLSLPFTPKTTLTICFWLYVIDSPYYTAVSITNSSVNPSLQVDINNTSSVIPVAMPGQWTIVHNVSSSGPGQWCHYAVTVNYTTFTSQAYINGSLSSTATGSSATGIAQTLFFLGRSGDNYRAFNGYLRQFLYYPRVLNASEVSAIYTNTA
jgi:Concanavalin A-like lectin/glucanases superfamily/Glycine rich protein